MGNTRGRRRKAPSYLHELTLDEKRFQDRSPVAAGYAEYGRHKGRSEAHIRSMAEWIRTNEAPLDPLIIWQDPTNERWYVVDGFHRYKAYQHSIRGKRVWRPNKKVPCEVVNGSEREVVFDVYQDNHKGKLGFSQKQRLQFAWEQLWQGRLKDLSSREAAGRCTVGKDSILEMRKAAEGRYKDHTGPEPPCLWVDARSDEEETPEVDPDSQSIEREAREAAKDLEEVLEAYGWRLEVLGPAMEMVTEGHPDIEGRITERTDPDQEPDF